VSARITLARVHAARGEREKAFALALEALRLAHSERRADLLPEAQATLAALQSGYTDFRVANP
jgi:hypothetical protein